MRLLSKLLLATFLLVTVDLTAQINLGQGLIMYLPLDGNANDASGNGNNGIVNGPIPTTNQAGTPNTAYSFNGNGDFISIPHNPSQLVTSFSLCAKVQPTAFNSNACSFSTIIAKSNHQDLGHIGLSMGAQVGRTCNNPVSISNQIFMDYLGDHYIDVTNTTGLPVQPYIILNNWYCVVRTFDAITGNLKEYVNGNLHLDTTLSPLLYTGNSTDSITIGKLDYLSQFPFYFNGKIDEVRMYNRVLNEQEVVAYCNVTSCDTIADFTFTETCGTVNFSDASTSNCVAIGNWVWDFGDGTSTTANVAPSHTYSAVGVYPVQLKIYDPAGNILDSVTKNVNIADLTLVDAGPDASVCAGNSINLNASATGTSVTFAWQMPSAVSLSDPTISNPVATPTSNTTYTVVATDDVTGCSDTDDVSITVINPTMTITATPTGTTCIDQNVTLSVSPTTFVSYDWSPATQVNDPTLPVVTAFGDTSIMYTVEVEDINGCTVTDSILVEKYIPPKPSIGYALLSCADYQFVASNGTGTVVTRWDWDFGDGVTDTGVAPTHTYGSNGTFVVTLTASYGNGCAPVTVYDTIDVTAIVNVQAAPDTIICPGAEITLQATGAENYTWINNTLGLSNTTIPNPQAAPATTTTYTVVGTFGNGCSDTDDVVIAVIGDYIDIQGPDRICLSESGLYSLTSTSTYSNIAWQPSSIMSNPNAEPTLATPPSTSTTFITVSATSANGCIMQDTFYIQVDEMPDFGIDLPEVLCADVPIAVSGRGGGDYSWEPYDHFVDPFAQTTTLSVSETTPIYLSITGVCKDTTLVDTLRLANEAVETQVTYYDSAMSCINSKVALQATGGVAYSWSPAEIMEQPYEAKTFARLEQENMIYSDITDAFGCHHYDTIRVDFRDRTARFFMPNVFSIGKNTEKYKIMSDFYFELEEFAIYDRWGNKIWATNDILDGWDGVYSEAGDPIVNENYVWVITGRTLCGPFQEQGTVLLVQ